MLPFVILAASSPHLTLLPPSTSSPDLFLHKELRWGKNLAVKNILSIAVTAKCECRSVQQGAELWRWAAVAALPGSAGTNCQMTPGTKNIVVTIVLILALVSREKLQLYQNRERKTWKVENGVSGDTVRALRTSVRLSDWLESCFFLYVIFSLWSSAGIKYYHAPSQF